MNNQSAIINNFYKSNMRRSLQMEQIPILSKTPYNQSKKIKCSGCGEVIDLKFTTKHNECQLNSNKEIVANAFLLRLKNPEFHLNAPKPVKGFSMNSINLENYNLKGPMSEINQLNHLIHKQPAPDVFETDITVNLPQVTILKQQIQQTSNTVIKKRYESANKQMAKQNKMPKESQNFDKAESSTTTSFGFCSALNYKNKEIKLEEYKIPETSQESKPFTFNICKASNKTEQQSIQCNQKCCQMRMYQNKCPCCLREMQSGDNKSTIRSNYIIQKKRLFWEIWNQVKQARKTLPKLSFEQAFKYNRYADKLKWKQAVENEYFQ